MFFRIDFADFLRFVTGFGKSSNEAGFDAAFDLNTDGKVAFDDFLIFASSFGK